MRVLSYHAVRAEAETHFLPGTEGTPLGTAGGAGGAGIAEAPGTSGTAGTAGTPDGTAGTSGTLGTPPPQPTAKRTTANAETRRVVIFMAGTDLTASPFWPIRSDT
jgi:hypothetical protein